MTFFRKFLMAILPVLFIVALGSSAQAFSEDSSFLSRYDKYFWRYSSRYMPDHDWVWLKAQCYQESRLKNGQISPVGAKGVCQFMPGTWDDYQKAFEIVADVFNPHMNIRAAAWYMHRMERVWSGRDRTPEERLPLAQASYNYGVGNVLKAQARCNDERLIAGIDPCLPEETSHYWKLIRKHYWRFYHDE